MAGDYNQLFKVGDRIILELTNSDIFNGTYAEGGKNRIVLTDVVQHNNSNKLSNLYEFYRSEIANVHRLKTPPSKENKQTENVKVETNCAIIKVSQEEYFRLKDMSSNYIYIANADKRYFDAVKVLGDSETVGVVCLGMDNHRTSVLPLLVMCTWKQVYIFDLSNITKRELYKEVKEIFESENICKVIHKSAGIVDVLYRDYKIYVQNTFDTQVVDLMLQKKETGKTPTVARDLSECLVHYLDFPASILRHALSVEWKSWNERPLSDKKKLYAAQIATYLIVLKNQLQKLLLKDVYDAVASVQDCVYDMDDFNFLNFNVKKDVPEEVQDLIPDLKKLHL